MFGTLRPALGTRETGVKRGNLLLSLGVWKRALATRLSHSPRPLPKKRVPDRTAGLVTLYP